MAILHALVIHPLSNSLSPHYLSQGLRHEDDNTAGGHRKKESEGLELAFGVPRLSSIMSSLVALALPLLLLPLVLLSALGSATTTALQRLVTEEEEKGSLIAADQQWKIG